MHGLNTGLNFAACHRSSPAPVPPRCCRGRGATLQRGAGRWRALSVWAGDVCECSGCALLPLQASREATGRVDLVGGAETASVCVQCRKSCRLAWNHTYAANPAHPLLYSSGFLCSGWTCVPADDVHSFGSRGPLVQLTYTPPPTGGCAGCGQTCNAFGWNRLVHKAVL